MNITSLRAVPLTSTSQAKEPAAPGGSEADHGVALEFAVLLAGLLRTPVSAPPAPQASPVVLTTALDADGVVSQHAEDAESVEGAGHLIGGATPVGQGDAESTAADPTRLTGWGMVAPVGPPAAGSQQSVDGLAAPMASATPATPAEPKATATSVDTDKANPLVMVDGSAAKAAMAMDGDVAVIASAIESDVVASAGAPPTLDETPATSAGGVTTVIVRLAEAVAATVRQLLGQETTAAAQTGTSDGTDLHDADAPVAEGHAPVASHATTISGGTTGVTGRATMGMSSEGGGDASGGHAETHDRTAGADHPVAALRETTGGAFADLARLAGAASTGGAVSRASSAAPAAVVAPPVMAQPDPPPTPATPQTVTVRFDGPGGSESRIRVSVRGDLVHATILTDAQSAPRLEQSLPELQRALADRGFSESRVSVRIMATDGSLPVTTRAEVGSSDASRQRDGQGRQGSERDFAGDERPRGKRHQTGEEAQR